MMRVDHRSPVDPRERMHSRAKPGVKTRLPAQAVDRDSLFAQTVGPRPGFIQAADSHRNLTAQATDEVNDEPFRASGIEADDDLQNSGSGRQFGGQRL